MVVFLLFCTWVIMVKDASGRGIPLVYSDTTQCIFPLVSNIQFFVDIDLFVFVDMSLEYEWQIFHLSDSCLRRGAKCLLAGARLFQPRFWPLCMA
ncbi:hypothetical protein BGZ63DRAFT_63723 [Mariannaea sp. PMI_226]|nr:hypothetical protein BGZ63DRAFT_63723 [Mariannaea sp. PMI_226]